MALYAMWVPGSAALGQPGMYARGFLGGAQYSTEDHADTGFVTATIPTPVIVNGRRTHLVKMYVLYRTEAMRGQEARLVSVAVYDGPRLVRRREDWAQGDYTSGLWPENVMDFPDLPDVQFGIQVALEFKTATPGVRGTLVCCGFGVDFDDAAVPRPIIAGAEEGGAKPV